MAQDEVTILRVRKTTRNKLRRRALTKRESYDEIINRLIEKGTNVENVGEEDLEKKKQRLLKMGISKELVNLLGVAPKMGLNEEKAIFKRALIKKMSK